jgi:succinyl-CoA synthetase beta subunit
MLTAYGVPVVHSIVAGTAQAAVTAAERIGPPVVVKSADPDAVHKTELGLVRTGLVAEDDIRSAVAEMALAQGQLHAPVLVQPQVAKGVEIAIGMVRDPVFGPILMLAAGGVTTDVLDDRVFLLPPVTDTDATKAVRGLRLWPLLAGFRGSPACDVLALQRVLQSVAQLASDVPVLVELDINPIVVTPEGVVSVDVKARLEESQPHREELP